MQQTTKPHAADEQRPAPLPMGRFVPTAEDLKAEIYASAPVVELDGGDIVVLTTDPDCAAQAVTAYAQAYDLPLDGRALARLRSRWVTFERQPEGDWLLDDAQQTDALATRVHYLLG
ncbi:hypothetical protein [Streptomyces sp. Vc17.3-30]|uniref:hypothetical protein n=1 Tax=Streptomyces sp. Vc17.3-30 TaxID=2841672 RepID=UPI00209427E9|nr:hypothetical protein [Streptomyces sp. Vc17.3-30]MCO6698851.1 hypothetical protein [Streptomyces sp. Vc17.3-30]